MSSPTKLREMAKELGWPPELEKAADQLQKLKRENAALREQLNSVQKSHFTLSKDNAALRAALAFYADPQSYGINGGNFHRVASDHGMKARAALAGKDAQP